MRVSTLASIATVTLAFGGLVACYTVDFDPNANDVYYCTADSDCSEGQSCSAFACVDDSGPQVAINGPELLQNLAAGTATLTVNYSFENFTISDSNEKIEGQGKMLVSIVGTDIQTVSVVEAGAQLDISTLAPGTYRLEAKAVFGDESSYTNPSASAYTVFYIEDTNTERPQAAIVSPGPNKVHVVDEDLEIVVAARNFLFQSSGEDCRIDADCDPWGADADLCLPACELNPSGHAHLYFLDDYPACLNNEIDCNGDYVLSLRPSDNVDSDGVTATATIPANRFSEPGTYVFSIGLQYNDHEPYPGPNFIIYDQVEVEVVER